MRAVGEFWARVREHDSTWEPSGQRRTGRTSALLAALALVLTAVPFMAATVASGANGTPARSAGFNTGGFPLWFEDATGVRVQPCLDPAEVNCLAPLANPGVYDPNQPLAFPSNYPDEFFYFAADSAPVAVADCAVTPGAGVSVHLALEAAFINGNPAPGDQQAFGRIRPNAKGGTGLCANSYYTLRTPYGPLTIKTDSNGEVKGGAAAAVTSDVGCFPTPAVPCDWNLPFQATHLSSGLLRQANAVPGYLGNAGFGPVTGGKDGVNTLSIVKWPAGLTPAVGFGIDCTDPLCEVRGTTANFNVLAKLAGPLTSDVTTVDFGGQATGGTSAARTITITNLGSGPLGLDPIVVDHVVVTGAASAQFTPTTTTCSVQQLVSPDAATALQRDAACSIDVTFTPAALGATGATLEVWAVGVAAPYTVALVGTGVEPTMEPGISVDPAGLELLIGDVRVTTASAIVPVTVTNPGLAPLQLQPSILAGAQSATFAIAGNSCPTGVVAPSASCVIGIKFTPAVAGPHSAVLQLATNVPAQPTVNVLLTANATGGVADVAPDLVNGFPAWYQDEHGVRVGQCADPANALCIASPIVGDVVFPTNYPDEAFYYLATSEPIVVSDASCTTTTGEIFVEAGVEAAFITPGVTDGQQMTFGRIRFVGGRKGGLCPNTAYVLTFPYGRSVLTTDAAGAIKPSPGTSDVGCMAAPCDFRLALASPVFAGFLQQTTRPAGWLGNPLSPSTVTGAPYIDPDTGTAANHFTIQRLDTIGTPEHTLLGATDLFGVSGRLAGPMVADPGAIDFGAADVATGTVDRSVTYTNVGPDPVTLANTPWNINSTGNSDFTVTGGDCVGGLVLPNLATCSLTVRFDPTATGPRSSDLVLRHDGQNDPLTVVLTGVGSAPVGEPAISVQPSAIVFTDRHVDTLSESQVVVVSNLGGSAPLVVGTPTITAGAPFELTNDCALPVDPDAACSLSVRFAPTAAGDFTADLTVPSNAGPVTVTLSGSATTAVPAQSGAQNVGGFPLWIQDDNGVRLEQCVSTEGFCVLAGSGFDIQRPLAFPTNYPVESFYSLVDSELVGYGPQVCGDGSESAGGFALLRMATEAAFVTPTPQAGQQNLFNRIRITASGLCANTSYQMVHPYGTTTVTADGAGDVKATFDTGAITGTDPVLDGFLRWDPNVAPAAPAGHLGDGTSFHQIVGSVYRPVLGGEPANYFQVVQGADVIGATNRFLVAGRLAGPVVPNLTSKDFGTVRQGANSATQDFVISNIGSTPVSGFTTSVTGADGSLFAITSNTCSGATLARDQSCIVQVRLQAANNTPIAAKAATLVVGHDGLRSPISIALTGNVITSAQPALTVTPTSLTYAATVVGTTSATQNVVIRNSGTAPMTVGLLAFSGANANQFRFVSSTSATACPVNGTTATGNLAAGASCTIGVAFRPTASGAKTATLSVAATDPATGTALTPINVTLTGQATAATVSLSATTVSISGRAGRTSTASVQLTNNGTANFSLAGNPALYFTAVSANGPTTKFTATHTCNNIAPGKRCQVTISFTPGNGAVGEQFVTDLYMFGAMTNTVTDPRPLSPTFGQVIGGVKVRVTGTRAR